MGHTQEAGALLDILDVTGRDASVGRRLRDDVQSVIGLPPLAPGKLLKWTVMNESKPWPAASDGWVADQTNAHRVELSPQGELKASFVMGAFP
jgi:hypothetical protein